MKLLYSNKTVEHELKTWTKFYVAVELGTKTFELRKNDRGFQVGHVLHLRDWDNEKERYTGRSCKRQITYILEGGQFGLEEGYVILGLKDFMSYEVYLQNL